MGAASKSVGINDGANVREGARRRVRKLGRRMGEVDRPRGGTVAHLLEVPCDSRGGGACGASDASETAGVAWKSCLEELLSGMLDKWLKTSPGIADTKVISGVASR